MKFNTEIFHPISSSKDDIQRIQQLAEENNLEVIPLIQTFGHFEVCKMCLLF